MTKAGKSTRRDYSLTTWMRRTDRLIDPEKVFLKCFAFDQSKVGFSPRPGEYPTVAKTEMDTNDADSDPLATSRSHLRRKGINVRRGFLIDDTAIVGRGLVVGLDPG